MFRIKGTLGIVPSTVESNIEPESAQNRHNPNRQEQNTVTIEDTMKL